MLGFDRSNCSTASLFSSPSLLITQQTREHLSLGKIMFVSLQVETSNNLWQKLAQTDKGDLVCVVMDVWRDATRQSCGLSHNNDAWKPNVYKSHQPRASIIQICNATLLGSKGSNYIAYKSSPQLFHMNKKICMGKEQNQYSICRNMNGK